MATRRYEIVALAMWKTGVAIKGGKRVWFGNQKELALNVGISRRWLVSCIQQIITKEIGKRVGRGVYELEREKIEEINNRIKIMKQGSVT